MRSDSKLPRLPKALKNPAVVFFLLVTFLSFFTYFYRYWDPPNVYWDENYHIASAQKYLHGVFFMEQHPPLGKLLIAFGEKVLHPNARTDQFLGTDYGTQFDGISFAGYRFFPALLSWLVAPILYLLFLRITKKPVSSTLLSFVYIFDNALIVHSRGAMLEGPLMFFGALFLLIFFYLLDWKKASERSFTLLSIAFGAVFAMILTTKVLGLIFILFPLALLWKLTPDFARIAKFFVLMFVSFLLVYISIWQIHFSLGSSINTSLPDAGFYHASEEYKDILAAKGNKTLANFPLMLRDSLAYVPYYNQGAPRLDLCKKDENGSPFYFWPLGARTINYRWETPDGNAYRYLYLVPNPVIWWGAFASVLLAAALLAVSVLAPLSHPLKHRYLLTIFLGTYLSYMIAISRIPRVLYLYHYFIPLLFSFVLFALVTDELRVLGRLVITESRRITLLLIFGILAFLAFLYYSPLTYYLPLTDAQMNRRSFFSLWGMHCVKCEKPNGLAVPTK